MDYDYNPVTDINYCLFLIINIRENSSLSETKEILSRIEISAKKAVNCAKRGVYYRHWCGFLSYLNGVYVEIGNLMENTDDISQKIVQELLENAYSGLFAFSTYATKNLPQIIELVEIVEPVFRNTVLAFKELSKCLKEGLLTLVNEAIKKMKELWDQMVKFFKNNCGNIFGFAISTATTAGIISRAVSSGVCVGAGTVILQHCLIGGAVGLSVGIVVSVVKEGLIYMKDRKKRQRNKQIKNLVFVPEVDAKEAEKRGLEEIQLKIEHLIKQLKISTDKESRIEFSHAYCLLRGNLLELQQEIPKVAVANLEHED